MAIMNSPTVSVILAVYNGSAYIQQAIESILTQTFADFELILIDDGSTDDTLERIQAYADPRIRLLKNIQNIGLTKSLNKGIKVSRGQYLARQDADDYSLPTRLEKQVAYLENNPNVGLVGCGSRWLDGNDNFIRDWQPPAEPKVIMPIILSTIPFLHGTFMFRCDCLSDINGGYNESMPVAQDCDLLLRLSERWDLANLPEILYIHRRHDNTVTAKRSSEQVGYLNHAQARAIKRRIQHGWSCILPLSNSSPTWIKHSSRFVLAQRYAWWSAGAREIDRKIATQFLLIALLLNPMQPEIWSYLKGIIIRKTRAFFLIR